MAFAGQRLQREQPALAPGADADGHRRGARGVFLSQRIPLAAGFALAGPAVISRAAVLADKGEGGFGHGEVSRFSGGVAAFHHAAVGIRGGHRKF
jgi:hypothetical protein